jgi:zinc transport system substrate-binding protein
LRLILILIFVTLGAACLLPACGGSSPGSGREEVVAGFYPLAFAAEQVTGDVADVTNLSPTGAEPHDLELSPRDVAEVQGADLVLLLGHGFQPQVEDAAGDGPNVLRLLDTPGLDLLPGDPHVWLDPVRYAAIVRRIGTALARPARADELVARLHTLDGEYRAGLANCDRRELVTSHEAFGYLADRYGLEQVAVTGLSPESEVSPGKLEEVVDRVRGSGATTVFVEPLVSPRIAETLARETGATTAVLDPIEGLTEDGAAAGDDYFSLMRRNLDALRKGLGCG